MSQNVEAPRILKNGIWVAVEGTDAVGKTKLSRELTGYLKSRFPEVAISLTNEFSDSPIGRLIREVIDEKTFFMLGDRDHFPVSETLVLASDFLFQRESALQSQSLGGKGVVLSDRGIYSFFVYQGIRLRDKYGEGRNWDQWIDNIFLPLGKPDMTICLTSPMDQIERRLVERGDVVTEGSMEFISQVQNEFLRLGGSQDSKAFVVLENLDGEFSETLNTTQKLVADIIIPS